MTNPSHLFRTQGHITKIINDTIVDDSKWNIFSENGKKFKGQLSVLDKKFKFRDINLQDISNIIEKQALKLNQHPSKYSNVKQKYTKRRNKKTKKGKKSKRKTRKIGKNNKK